MPRITHEQAENYQSSLNGEWFSLKDDRDVARVQFMMDKLEDLDVFACHRVKIGDKERYVDCLRTYDEPIDKCPFCAAGIPVKPVRFVIMYQHDDQKVKIWERGKQFIAKLQSLCNRYTPLSDYVFEIERVGKAGSKDTRYEIYPMDRIEPTDLTQIEKPELLGGLILDKSAEEMEVFLETGNFPQTESDDNDASAGYARRQPSTESHQVTRRAPAGRATTAPEASAGVSRRGPAPGVASAPAEAPARGPVRGGRRSGGNNEEVF